MDTTFSGLHVVVTGAGGELGAAVTELLLEAGAVCHLPVRRAPPELERERARVVEGVDLADETLVERFYRELPGLWASIHCAGAFSAGPIAETRASELERMLAVNARTAFLCSREAVRALREKNAGRGGRIVNVVSRQALDPRRGAGMSAYAMSKAALAALTVSLAQELADERILVNAIAPSTLDTASNRSAMPGADFSRWVTLEEAARAALQLAAPAWAGSGALVPVYGRA